MWTKIIFRRPWLWSEVLQNYKDCMTYWLSGGFSAWCSGLRHRFDLRRRHVRYHAISRSVLWDFFSFSGFVPDVDHISLNDIFRREISLITFCNMYFYRCKNNSSFPPFTWNISYTMYKLKGHDAYINSDPLIACVQHIERRFCFTFSFIKRYSERAG